MEGDFRYVDSGAFDECVDFLEYLEYCDHNWEEAFGGWFGVSNRWREHRQASQNNWGPWNLVKVCCLQRLNLQLFQFIGTLRCCVPKGVAKYGKSNFELRISNHIKESSYFF